ncbi:MAG: hypothetical protein ABIC57_03905, partial [bacterium]
MFNIVGKGEAGSAYKERIDRNKENAVRRAMKYFAASEDGEIVRQLKDDNSKGLLVQRQGGRGVTYILSVITP